MGEDIPGRGTARVKLQQEEKPGGFGGTERRPVGVEMVESDESSGQ